MKLIILLLVGGCTVFPALKKTMGVPEKAQEKVTSNREAWIGQPDEAIDLHAVFPTMTEESSVTPSGIKIRKFKNTSGMAQKRECELRWGAA